MRNAIAQIATSVGLIFVLCLIASAAAQDRPFEVYATIIREGGVSGERLIETVKMIAGNEYVSREIIVNGVPEFFEIGRVSGKSHGGDLVIVTGSPPFDSRIHPQRIYYRIGVQHNSDKWRTRDKGEPFAPVDKNEVIKQMNDFLGLLDKALPSWQREFK